MLHDEIELVSPESFVLQLEVGGVGTRFLAILVDVLLQAVLTVLIVFAGFGTIELTLDVLKAKAISWIGALVILLLFLVNWGYFVLFETLWNGQTPGKRAFGLRVAKMAGQPLTFFDSVVRNLIRFVDFLPFMYGLGVTVALCNRYYRRIGDYAAGTVVLRVRSPEVLPESVTDGSAGQREDTVPIDTPPAGPSQLTREELRALTARDYEIVRSFLLRRDELEVASRQRLADRIASAVKEKLSLPISDPRWRTSEEFLEAIASETGRVNLRGA